MFFEVCNGNYRREKTNNKKQKDLQKIRDYAHCEHGLHDALSILIDVQKKLESISGTEDHAYKLLIDAITTILSAKAFLDGDITGFTDEEITRLNGQVT